jgi:hypothetical protein
MQDALAGGRSFRTLVDTECVVAAFPKARVMVAATVGAFCSGALALSLYALGHTGISWLEAAGAPLTAIYALPGVPIALGLAPLLPDSFTYSIAPDGGPTALAGLVGGSAFLFWTVLFSWATSRYLRSRLPTASTD